MAKTTFKPSEALPTNLTKMQVVEVAAWVAANPTAIIQAVNIAEGALPIYLRRDQGKRADINRMLTQGMTVQAFITKARPLGGGWVDLVAAIVGGYSRAVPGYGNPAVRLVA